MRELLENLQLEHDVIDKILSKHNEALETTENLKLEVKKQLELSQNEVKARDKQLKELSKIDVEELNTKIKAFEQENKELVEKHIAEITELKIDYAIEKALVNAGARNLKATKSLLDLSNLSFDDNEKLVGLDNQIKALVEGDETSFLFKPIETEINTVRGLSPVTSESKANVSKITQNMSYEQICEVLGGSE